MIGALRHRGPDEFGVYRDHRAGLAHARLSIIDLATGQQPLANEDGTRCGSCSTARSTTTWSCAPSCVALGHRFRTQSDTEVIVHAYEQWGADAFARFNGQFAIALWDATAESLVLARDRLGVRPLYLCEHGGRLWFASEVKAHLRRRSRRSRARSTRSASPRPSPSGRRPRPRRCSPA